MLYLQRCKYFHNDFCTETFHFYRTFWPKTKSLQLTLKVDDSSIWSEKCVLFAFYQQLIHRLRWQRHINIVYWTTFAATFVAVELSTFLDCRPFRLYFEIVSDPNSCIRAYSQIISYGKNLHALLLNLKHWRRTHHSLLYDILPWDT